MTTTSQRRARTLDAPRFEYVRNDRTRRRLVAALVTLLAVEFGLFALIEVDHVLPLVGLAVLAFAFVIVLGMLKASTRGVEELSEDLLDERQAQVRGRVFATAYRIGAGLLTVGLATVVVWHSAGWPPPGEGVVIGALVVPFHIAIVLPTLVAAARHDV